MSVCFLEATINELFADCYERPGQVVKKGLREGAVRDAGLLWRHGVPRTAKYSIQTKYKKAAEIFDSTLDFGRRPGQDVLTIVELRNELVHAEPAESVVFSSDELTKLSPARFEERVQGRFDLNPHAGQGDAFFPSKMLSVGCAAWAVTTAVSFTDEFFARIGMVPPYDHIRERLALGAAPGAVVDEPGEAK